MPKKVFISYSWDSKEHQEWVVALTNTLRETYGIDSKCDVLLDKPNLFSMMVQEAQIKDKIVIVDTKRYTEKANNEQGGVGYETKLFYNFFQNQPQKLIVIKRGICDLPFYLAGWNYIDFTGGVTEENLDALALRINDEAPYKMAPLADTPRVVKSKAVESAFDENIIPDLRPATLQGKDDYLKEQFNITDKTILDLLRQTKQKNPELNVEHEKREANVPLGSSVFIGNSLQPQVNHYTVCSYTVKYQEKEAYYKIWLSLNEGMMGKGIFGISERPFWGMGQEFNSYQLWVHVSPSAKEARLECGVIGNSEQISNGKELGKYIFKRLIGQIQRL